MSKIKGRSKELMFLILGTLLIATVGWAHFQIDSTSAFAQILATSLLVLASMISAAAAWSNVEVGRKSREQDLRPIFIFEAEGEIMSQKTLVMHNIGKGPASDIELTLKLEPNGPESELITRENLNPNDLTTLTNIWDGVEFDPLSLSDHFDRIVIKGKYENVYGTTISLDKTYNLQDFSGRNIHEDILKSRDKTQELSEIKSAIKDVGTELSHIEVTLNALWTDQYGRSNYRRVPRDRDIETLEVTELERESEE